MFLQAFPVSKITNMSKIDTIQKYNLLLYIINKKLNE